MIELRDQESIDRLLERFYRFHDALLLGVFLFLPHEEDDKATIRVWAEEGGTGGSGRWLVVEFHVNRVHAFKFEEGPKGIEHRLFRGPARPSPLRWVLP